MRHPIIFIGLILAMLTSIIHSQDTTTILPKHENYIDFHWKGGLTSHSIILKVFPRATALTTAGYSAFLACYIKTDDNANPISTVQIEPLTFEGDTYPVATVEIINLQANTEYSYTFVISPDAVTPETFTASYPTANFTEFEFETFGVALKPYSFTFGASCCAQTGSSNIVFDTLRKEDMAFFIHTGDLHSEGIATNDTEKFYKAYYSVLNSSVQKHFFQEHPVFYIWDDLDFGAHNANGTSPSRAAATEAYTRFVPAAAPKNKVPKDDVDAFAEGVAPVAVNPETQYQGGEPTDDGFGIYRSFIVGRCMFIIMDLKTYKDRTTDDILGSDQRSWLQNQFIFAKANTNIVQIFLISSVPWIHTTTTSDWGPYVASTQEFIATWVNDFKKDGRKVMLIAGDAHMVAFDDGSNNKYGGFPVVQAGALDQNPSCKGGPYSHGLYTGRERYALFDVIDHDNGTLCVKVHLEIPNAELIFYDTCHPKKSDKTAETCGVLASEGEESEGGNLSWLIILIGLILLGIGGYVGYNCYQQSNEEPQGKPEGREGNYMELSETRKKRENEQL